MVDPSHQDLATGLGNRRGLLAALRERMPAHSGALILLDLDGYDRATEGLERKDTDALLRETAARLKAAAGDGALLYRYGGDSFGLIVPDADRDKGASAAEGLRSSIDKGPFKLEARELA